MIKLMYILGLVFGVFAGLITAAFSFIPSLSSPVYRVCDALVALYCICDSRQLSYLSSSVDPLKAEGRGFESHPMQLFLNSCFFKASSS